MNKGIKPMSTLYKLFLEYGKSFKGIETMFKVDDFLNCVNHDNSNGLVYILFHPTLKVKKYELIKGYWTTYVPFYVGKGTGSRPFHQQKNISKEYDQVKQYCIELENDDINNGALLGIFAYGLDKNNYGDLEADLIHLIKYQQNEFRGTIPEFNFKSDKKVKSLMNKRFEKSTQKFITINGEFQIKITK